LKIENGSWKNGNKRRTILEEVENRTCSLGKEGGESPRKKEDHKVDLKAAPPGNLEGASKKKRVSNGHRGLVLSNAAFRRGEEFTKGGRIPGKKKK